MPFFQSVYIGCKASAQLMHRHFYIFLSFFQVIRKTSVHSEPHTRPSFIDGTVQWVIAGELWIVVKTALLAVEKMLAVHSNWLVLKWTGERDLYLAKNALLQQYDRVHL